MRLKRKKTNDYLAEARKVWDDTQKDVVFDIAKARPSVAYVPARTGASA